MSKKKISLLIIVCAVIVGAGILLWNRYASSTKIAFVNFQAINLGQLGKANDNSLVKIEELPVEEIGKAGKYDMVFVTGMGLRLTVEQRQALIDVAEGGTPVFTIGATNPDNNINSVDSIDAVFLKQYLTGGRNNYRNMLRYVRKYIDGKKLFVDMPGDPQLSITSMLYYPSEKEDLNFASVAEYEVWVKKSGKWKENAPHIILTGMMGVADSLVSHLEKTGNIVYPVSTVQCPAI